MSAGIPALPPPIFVNDVDGLDPNNILADMIAEFESASGRILQPAQVERVLLNVYACRESLVRNAIQFAAEQNLLAFASFPMIDYLGQLLSVSGPASQPAVTTIQFPLTSALTVPFLIAAGTLIGTNDGHFAFATSARITIPAGVTTASVAATATAPGAAANGYLPGQVNVQLSPSALIASATNTATTAGGSAPETDDHMRTRIQATPNQFSDDGGGERGGAGPGARAGGKDTARHRTEPDYRGAFGGGRLRGDALGASADDTELGAVGQLHGYHSDRGVRDGA